MQHVRSAVVEVKRPSLGCSGSTLLSLLGPRGPSDFHVTVRRGFTSTCLQSRELQRLSRFFIPTGGIEASEDQDDTHARLLRAGYLRQAHSGIFHMLPLGNRVQQKLESLIDKHMGSLGASKVSLSSITTEDLWQKSGRLMGHGSELFHFTDRKEGKFLLSPTHEEEITALVASTVKSYRDLPIRLYQVSRKYRDEQRPRQGLLRGREFVMKDLYTFDTTAHQAISTYEEVRSAYRAFLDELKVPYLVAKADSGSMGGNLSHEYHFISPKGEDNIICCDSCDHVINEELAILKHETAEQDESNRATESWIGISKDHNTLVHAVFPKYSTAEKTDTTHTRVQNEINLYAVKAALPEIDLDTGIEDPISFWNKRFDVMQIILIDPRLPPDTYNKIKRTGRVEVVTENRRARINNQPVLLTRTFPGDSCPNCKNGKIRVEQAIEIGHTFHLGTRYSKPLAASVVDRNDKQTFLEMGCHGIGVSRMIAAIASQMSDSKGLNWPAAIAPFNIAVLPAKMNEAAAEALVENLLNATGVQDFDPVLDDRDKTLGWKLKDADLIGYPILVIVGKAWTEGKKVEVQCRRLDVKVSVKEEELAETIQGLLRKL